tara:strand:+ start:5221 stop:5400 length:180 start_codon:yes stop_codon:yes gene_type:complete
MPKVRGKKYSYTKKGKSAAAKAKKDHKKLDKRFKGGVRKNNNMKIKSGPNGPKKRKRKK